MTKFIDKFNRFMFSTPMFTILLLMFVTNTIMMIKYGENDITLISNICLCFYFVGRWFYRR